MSTIFAVSSGRPPAAIAVIRVSGPAAFPIAEQIAGPLPEPRVATLRALRDEDGELLDRALMLAFPAPDSATGEDVAEFHCHGGRAVIQAIEARLARCDGVRQAEPGEFTRRGLLNGRFDLAQAEGLADLLEAETELQRRAALAGAEGRISALVRGWLDRITDLSARLEAAIDYSDEEDGSAQVGAVEDIGRAAVALGSEMVRALDAPTVERLRDPITIAIAGPANAGKSTLFNMLAERDLAIVSPRAGTTRDRLETALVRGGIPYLLLDTAGLVDGSDDPVEIEGMRRARSTIETCDVLMWAGDDPPPRDDALWLHMRSDLPDRAVVPAGRHCDVSSTREETISSLWAELERSARAILRGDGLPLRRHQRDAVKRSAELVSHVSSDELLMAENLRSARVTLCELLGINASELLLDRLFARFCLGK